MSFLTQIKRVYSMYYMKYKKETIPSILGL